MSLDLFNLSDNSVRTQIFYTSSNWVKPRGINFVNIFMVGAGGGGGGGTSSAGTAGGGGGGGSGGINNVTISADLITEGLVILIGSGGAGGTANNNGNSGDATYVFLVKGGDSTSTLTAVAGGGAGSAGSTGTAGVGGGATLVSQQSVGTLGLLQTLNGGTSSTAGSTTTPLNSTYGTSNTVPIMGGTGGGGKTTTNVNFSGGSIIGVSFVPTLLGGVTGNVDGSNGLFSLNPFYSLGGTGGAGLDGGTGGRGGNGAPGSGGGGGGGGNTGGAGGRGGDALVIITCW